MGCVFLQRLQHAIPEFIARFRTASIGQVTLALLMGLVLVSQVRAEVLEQTLWREGEDRYRELVATVQHNGTCQPECEEERMLLVPSDVRYDVRIEVLLADMHSAAEHVRISLGGIDVMCNPMPASDYNCSMSTCAQEVVVGPAASSGLHLKVAGQRMRDTCKCAMEDAGQLDCYSMLVSGLDETYGLLVRLTFTPLTEVRWVTGPWQPCNLKDCIRSSMSRRTVQCFMVDSGSNAGSGVGGSSILPDSPSWHWCADSAPPSERLCAEVPECAPPPLCRGCFSLALAVQSYRDLWWSATESSEAIFEGLGLGVAESGFLKLRLEAAPSERWGVSLSTCAGGEKILHGGPEAQGNASKLLLAADSSSQYFSERVTFGLRHIAAAVYAFDIPYSMRTVAAVDEELRSVKRALHCHVGHPATCKLNTMFAAWDADGLCGLAAPGDSSRYACQFTHGWCCSNPLDKEGRAFCQIGEEGERRECLSPDCSSAGYALLSKGRCEDIRCAPIEDHARCEIAAQSFGLRLQGGTRAAAEMLITSYQPSFCVWEPESINNEGAALWFNAQSTTLSSTPEFQQLCQCGGNADKINYFWSTSDWSDCSLSCGRQQRTRSVVCLARGVQVPPVQCREAGLEEPPHSEPCTTLTCFKSQANTRCAGKERPVDPTEIGPAANRIEGVTGGEHCIELHSTGTSAEPADLCRRSCVRMGDCAGFTFYQASRTSRKYAQCCFLQRVTRWEANFGHAVCHLAHGLRTHGGCTCQVGWAHDTSSGGRSVCGAGRGGCCTTAESGALSWCPTTSSSCGTRSQGQQHWDFCDPRGLAAITEHTCSSNPFLMHRGCVPARSVSQCNQIATALGLPDTTPTVTLSMHMPSACVWQSAASQLWLNQLVGAVNATNPSQIITVHASPELLELCSCPPEVFRWELGDWSPCFRDPATSCGAWKRSRSIFCIQEGIHGSDGSGDIVDDSFCAPQQPPPRSEMCTDCNEDVVRAELQFKFQRPQTDLQSQTFEKACEEDLAWAMGIEASRARVNAVVCCTEQVLLFDLLVSGSASAGVSSALSAGDALERLVKITRSPLDRSRFKWSSWFRPFAAHLSLRVLGIYSWESVGEWSGCDVQCGGGTQRRELQCIFKGHKSQPVRATSEFSCDMETRPEVVRVCSTEPCRDCPGFVTGSNYAASGGGHRMAHGSSVYVTCAAGFATADDVMLVGSTCDDGQWTPLSVSCGRSCPPFEVASWKYAVKGTGLLHGATRQVWCRDHPPSTVLEVPPSVTVVCQDGSWSHPVLACTGDCQEIELSDKYFVNGVNSSDGGSYAPHGAVRSVACASGFSSSNGSAAIEMRCNDGQWSVGSMTIPECKADCPQYQLPEGYEVEHAMEEAELALVEEIESGTISKDPDNSNERRPFMVSGARHGTSFYISCAHGYTDMPGAVERVQCTDGQWSALSLVCRKNCPQFDASSLDQGRYRVVLDKTLPNLVASSDDSPHAGQFVAHGSVVTIGCWRPYEIPFPSVAIFAEQEELRCENGLWSAQQLQCYHHCLPFVAGPQYIVSMLGFVHGARLLATCADDFSSYDNNTNGVRSPSLIDEAECVDGNWTSLRLQCVPDCPPLRPGPNYIVSGDSLKHGAMRSITCSTIGSQPGESKEVVVRCSPAGSWHVAQRVSEQSVSELAEEPLDLEHIPLYCPEPSIQVDDKLDASEREVIPILAILFCLSLCAFLGSWGIVRHLKSQRSTRNVENSGNVAALSSLEDTDTFISNFDDFERLEPEVSRGDEENVRTASSRSLAEFAGRLSDAARRRLQPAQVQEEPQKEPSTPICQCGATATHMCFPCNHVALCDKCAGEVTQKSSQGDVARCPRCYNFVDCAIDARPAPVFEAPRSLFFQWLQQRGHQLNDFVLQQLHGNFSRSSASSQAPDPQAEDPASGRSEAEFVHEGAGVRQLKPVLHSPSLGSQSREEAAS